MSQRRPGRIRRQLAKMLSQALSRHVEPDWLWDNNFPDAHMLGAARWGCSLPRGQGSIPVYSLDTMTECVRSGINIAWEDDGDTAQVHAIESAVHGTT